MSHLSWAGEPGEKIQRKSRIFANRNGDLSSGKKNKAYTVGAGVLVVLGLVAASFCTNNNTKNVFL